MEIASSDDYHRNEQGAALHEDFRSGTWDASGWLDCTQTLTQILTLTGLYRVRPDTAAVCLVVVALNVCTARLHSLATDRRPRQGAPCQARRVGRRSCLGSHDKHALSAIEDEDPRGR